MYNRIRFIRRIFRLCELITGGSLYFLLPQRKRFRNALTTVFIIGHFYRIVNSGKMFPKKREFINVRCGGVPIRIANKTGFKRL